MAATIAAMDEVWSAAQRWLPAVTAALAAALLIVRHRQRRLQAAHDALARQVQAQRAELGQAIDAMRLARDAAEAADLAKTRLVAAAGHDLRQPAHALGLYLAALRAGQLAPAQAEVAERMAATLATLQAMFGELLDVARIDAGAVVPRWDVVALAPLLRRLADEAAPAAEARGLRLVLRAGPDDAATVSDAQLLERIVRNLLANAVAATTAGGVLLACRLRSAASGQRAWRIEVWDSGRGIAAADRERVFDEFQQLRAGPGLGLGLAIVRRLAQLLQLQVRLQSRPGRGSVFALEGLLPAGAAPRRADAERGQMRRLTGTVVAVLDDDADVRDATARLLRLWHCDVAAGADAGELLRALEGAVPQALIADRHLGGGRRGEDEAAALVKAWGGRVPLLWVSADGAAADGDECLAKPVSPPRLRAWLERVVPDEGAS